MKNEEYHFSFIPTAIILVKTNNNQGINRDQVLRIALFRSTNNDEPAFIEQTAKFQIKESDQKLVILPFNRIDFQVWKFEPTVKERCLIKLLQIEQDGTQTCLGGYEFVLNQYIEAYLGYTSLCVDVPVQITQNIILSYQFYVDHLPQALEKIIQEHTAAKEREGSNFLVSEHEEEEFFDEVTEQLPIRPTQRRIQYDQTSPLFINMRSFSPKVERLNTITTENSFNQKESISFTDPDSNRLGFLHIIKRGSLKDQSEITSQKMKQSIKSDHILECDQIFDKESEKEEERDKRNQVFQVIQEGSRYYSSNAEDNQFLHRPKSERNMRVRESIQFQRMYYSVKQKTQPIEIVKIPKKRTNSDKKNFLTYIFIFTVIILLIYFALTPSNRIKIHKKNMKKAKIAKK